MWAKSGFDHTFRSALDDFEVESPAAARGHNEPAPLVGRVRLVMTPAAEGHEAIKIEVGAALRALHHMVDVEPAPDTTSLAMPARAGEDLPSDCLPLGDARGWAAYRTRSP